MRNLGERLWGKSLRRTSKEAAPNPKMEGVRRFFESELEKTNQGLIAEQEDGRGYKRDYSAVFEEKRDKISEALSQLKSGNFEVPLAYIESKINNVFTNEDELDDLISYKKSLKPEEVTEALEEEKIPDAYETVVESTPKEDREKPKEVIERVENLQDNDVKEQKDEHVKAYEANKEYFASRNVKLDVEAKKLGIVEKSFRWIGEKYKKLGWKSKLGVGLALGVGAAAFTTVSMPIAFTCMSGIAAQRIAGLASSFLKYEKKGKGKEGFWAGKEGTMLKAMAYSFGMSAAIGEAVHLASESSYGEVVHEWLKHHYPFGSTSQVIPEQTPEPHEVIAPASEVSVPEMPDTSVDASPGHGYEWMMKRMWEQLQDRHLDPSQYTEHSDIHKLLSADAGSIDRVAHQIASDPDHGFFNADGSSVVIKNDAHMTLDINGDINIDGNIKA